MCGNSVTGRRVAASMPASVTRMTLSQIDRAWRRSGDDGDDDGSAAENDAGAVIVPRPAPSCRPAAPCRR